MPETPTPKTEASQEPVDLESQSKRDTDAQKNVSAFKSLGWLDRFLALWIFLAMAIGIILGNFVPSTGPALQKGKFVGVSVPIGKCSTFLTPEQKEKKMKRKGPVLPHNDILQLTVSVACKLLASWS